MMALMMLITLNSGTYVCKNGNEESICDQKVRAYQSTGELTAIEVEYVGYCGSMGPYTYYCSEGVCETAGIRFEIKDPTRYRWENTQYGFFCDFGK